MNRMLMSYMVQVDVEMDEKKNWTKVSTIGRNVKGAYIKLVTCLLRVLFNIWLHEAPLSQISTVCVFKCINKL